MTLCHAKISWEVALIFVHCSCVCKAQYHVCVAFRNGLSKYWTWYCVPDTVESWSSWFSPFLLPVLIPLWDMGLSWHCYWGFKSSGTWYCYCRSGFPIFWRIMVPLNQRLNATSQKTWPFNTSLLTFYNHSCNTTVSPFSNRFWWIRMRPQLPSTVSLLCSSLSTLLSSFFHFVRFSVCALWTETVTHLMPVVLPRSVCILLKRNLHAFFAFCSLLYFYYWCFVSSWNQTGILCWTWIAVFVILMFTIDQFQWITNIKTYCVSYFIFHLYVKNALSHFIISHIYGTL